MLGVGKLLHCEVFFVCLFFEKTFVFIVFCSQLLLKDFFLFICEVADAAGLRLHECVLLRLNQGEAVAWESRQVLMLAKT